MREEISHESARRTHPVEPLDFENTSEIPPLKEVIGHDYTVFSHNMDAMDGLDSDGYENGEELDAGPFRGSRTPSPTKRERDSIYAWLSPWSPCSGRSSVSAVGS